MKLLLLLSALLTLSPLITAFVQNAVFSVASLPSPRPNRPRFSPR